MNGAVIIFSSCFNQAEGFVAHIYLQENILKELKDDIYVLKYLC
jgi:hypothetical protein